MFFFTNLTYFLAICLIKAAYLLFYAELCAKGAHTLQQHTLWAATLIWATTNVAGLFIVFFWCNPVTDNWTGGSSNRCPAYLSTGPILIQGILNIISDLAS